MQRIDHGDNRIVHLNFDTQYELCSTFVRVQEFYESPFEGIRGHYFTLEEFMDHYAKTNGNFTYFSDWGGFNVPGDVVNSFFDKFDELRQKEHVILDAVKPFWFTSDKHSDYYVIGTYADADGDETTYVAHEIAHAYYYLDATFKSAQDSIYEQLDSEVKARVAVALIDMGYSEQVILDETQAYFATDDENVLRKRFNLEGLDVSASERFSLNLDRVRKSSRS